MVDIFKNRSEVARKLKQDNMFGNYILSVGYRNNHIGDQYYLTRNLSFKSVIRRLSQAYQYNMFLLYGIWDSYYKKVLN